DQVLHRPRAAAADVRHVAVAVGADRPGQLLGADTGDRLLTRRVDVQDDEDVGLVEGGEELLAQVMGARIPMRLKYGDEPTLEAPACAAAAAPRPRAEGSRYRRPGAPPPPGPRTGRRRCTPVKPASAFWIASNGISRSSPTPMAARALRTLWRPGICNVHSPS